MKYHPLEKIVPFDCRSTVVFRGRVEVGGRVRGDLIDANRRHGPGSFRTARHVVALRPELHCKVSRATADGRGVRWWLGQCEETLNEVGPRPMAWKVRSRGEKVEGRVSRCIARGRGGFKNPRGRPHHRGVANTSFSTPGFLVAVW